MLDLANDGPIRRLAQKLFDNGVTVTKFIGWMKTREFDMVPEPWGVKVVNSLRNLYIVRGITPT